MTQAVDAAGEPLSPGAWVACSTPSGIKFGVVMEIHEALWRGAIPVTVLCSQRFRDTDAWRNTNLGDPVPLKPPVAKRLKLDLSARTLIIKRSMVPFDEQHVLEEASAKRMPSVALWERQ